MCVYVCVRVVCVCVCVHGVCVHGCMWCVCVCVCVYVFALVPSGGEVVGGEGLFQFLCMFLFFVYVFGCLVFCCSLFRFFGGSERGGVVWIFVHVPEFFGGGDVVLFLFLSFVCFFRHKRKNTTTKF